MDVIFDILVEATFEIFAEGFVRLYSTFVPDRVVSKKALVTIHVIFIFIALALLIGLFVGIVLLVETRGQSILGRVLVSLAVIYVISGIILKFFCRTSNRKH